MNENPNQNSPVNGGNNDFGFNFSPENAPAPKGGKAKVVCFIAIFVIAIGIITAVACIIFNPFASPEEKFSKAVNNTAGNYIGGVSGNKDSIANVMISQPTETNFSITYKGSDYYDEYSDFEGSGIEGTLLYDPKNEEAGGNIDISAAGINVSLAEFYADSTAVYGRSPELEDTWIKVDLQDMFSKYNDSVFAENGNEIEYDDDLSLNLFELAANNGNSFLLYNYLNSNRDAFKELQDKMTVEITDETYTTDSGKKATGFDVTINTSDFSDIILDFNDYIQEENVYGELIEQLLPLLNAAEDTSYDADEIEDMLYDSLDEGFKEMADAVEETDTDIEFVAYVCGSQIVKIEYEDEIENDYGDVINVELTALLPLESDDEQVTNIEIVLSDDYDNEYNLTFDLEYSKKTTEYSLDITLDGGYDYASLTSEGTYEKTKDSVRLEADDISLVNGYGDTIFSFAVSFDVSPLSGTIEKPDEDDVLDVFTASESDFEDYADEFSSNLYSLYFKFSDLFY